MSDNKNFRYEEIDEFEIVEYLRSGAESLVFKGIKKNVRRTYALKFQIRSNYQTFSDYALPVYQKLEKGSVGHIAGLIENVPPEAMKKIFTYIPPKMRKTLPQNFSENDEYFCIIEDFIQGCNLSQYCHGDSQKSLPAHCPPKNADYAEVQSYEKMIFNWIEQFCDIMIKVTDENRVIHMDIKPENIMVTDDTKSLVLIDFGTAANLDSKGKYDLNKDEFSKDAQEELKKQGNVLTNFGTPGYAAPEAHYSGFTGRPDIEKDRCGHIDQRSDIFSFGATLWDCLTPDLQVRSSINSRQYYHRDLFSAPSGYSSELEQIIIKCTQKYPEQRYASFAELKAASIEAEKKRPTFYKSKKTQHGLFMIASLIFLLGLFSLGINIYSSGLSVQIAEEDLHNVRNVNYNLKTYQTAAENLLDVKADKASYDEILNTVLIQQGGNNNEINSDIATVLMGCLQKTNDESIIRYYVDTIMEKAELISVLKISSTISSNEQVKNISIGSLDSWSGRDLANARKNLDEGRNLSEAYNVLIRVNDDVAQRIKYQNVLYDIAFTINGNSKYKEVIQKSENLSSERLTKQLNTILAQTKKEVKQNELVE